MASGRRWTRDELFVALNLYHKFTFGQLHARQPAIVAMAEKLRRNTNALAMKLCNFASLDPALKLRGIKGLEGASALDRTVWEEFHADLSETVPASEDAIRKLFNVDEDDQLEVLPKEGIRIGKRPPIGPTERIVNRKQRRGQDYFRDIVLNNYDSCCALTGLPIRELLIASHILPWRSHEAERLNVRNGIALNRLHDAAFDQGLITFDDSLCLVLSPRLKAELPQRAVAENFDAYENEPLHLPDDAVPPELAFLVEHRAKKFQKK
jgi:putative restriction endonuclease